MRGGVLELQTHPELHVARSASGLFCEKVTGIRSIDDRPCATGGGIAVQVIGIQQIFRLSKCRQMVSFANVEVAFDLSILLREAAAPQAVPAYKVRPIIDNAVLVKVRAGNRVDRITGVYKGH